MLQDGNFTAKRNKYIMLLDLTPFMCIFTFAFLHKLIMSTELVENLIHT